MHIHDTYSYMYVCMHMYVGLWLSMYCRGVLPLLGVVASRVFGVLAHEKHGHKKTRLSKVAQSRSMRL